MKKYFPVSVNFRLIVLLLACICVTPLLVYCNTVTAALLDRREMPFIW